MDDKAYVRPRTSEGFSHARKTRILTPAASDRARSLPKYDWPESAVYVTPSTHRFVQRVGVTVDGVEKLVSCGDRHIVFVRPKAIVGSSGTTWASETVCLSHMFPELFDSLEINPSTMSHSLLSFQQQCEI